MLKITPNATPNAAANNTCSVPGNRNVIVCAGYQFFHDGKNPADHSDLT